MKAFFFPSSVLILLVMLLVQHWAPPFNVQSVTFAARFAGWVNLSRLTGSLQSRICWKEPRVAKICWFSCDIQSPWKSGIRMPLNSVEMQAICREIIYHFLFSLPEFREVLLKIHPSSPPSMLFPLHFSDSRLLYHKYTCMDVTMALQASAS